MNNDALSTPESEAAEQSVLGACLLSLEALEAAVGTLQPSDFTVSDYRQLFGVMSEMYVNDKPVDLLTVTEELKARGIYDRLGGQSFLVGLASCVNTTANVPHYAKVIREYAIRRSLITAGANLSSIAQDFSTSIPDIMQHIETVVFNVGRDRLVTEFQLTRNMMGKVFVDIEDKYKSKGTMITGYPTGYDTLDALTGGLQPGSLSVIAARPSMGKTALALNIAQFGGSLNNNPVLVFSVEMPSEQLIQRMLAAEARINLSHLTRGILTASEFETLRKAADVVGRRNIYIDDTSQLTAMEFFARCRRFKNLHPDVDLVVVDYLQLMTGGDKYGGNRNLEVGEISRMLKAAAREINCPVIALSQLSRDVEKRNDKKPLLSDLRDSGSIEQDADLVILLYREDYYSEHENSDISDSKADVRIAKNRNGSTGVCHLTFRREITRFFDYGLAVD